MRRRGFIGAVLAAPLAVGAVVGLAPQSELRLAHHALREALGNPRLHGGPHTIWVESIYLVGPGVAENRRQCALSIRDYLARHNAPVICSIETLTEYVHGWGDRITMYVRARAAE